MKFLSIASCMAENGEGLSRGVASYIRLKLGLPTEYISDLPWQQRERLFEAGGIEILWLCGLPYVHKADVRLPAMEILAVPVPAASRYGGRPVYFSDVIVRRPSRFRKFTDLRGASLAYNEPRSHSGFNVVRAYISELSEPRGFFASVHQSGAHTASIEMVLSGAVDAAAVDSTVLEWSAAARPAIMDELRVVHTFGPSPIPPWVVAKRVAPRLRAQLRTLMIGMDRDAAGRSVLEKGRMARFVAACDCDYDPIRRMAARAEQVELV
jgi:phosphonate transport system substrate-binding protein